MQGAEKIKQICTTGTPEEKKVLFGFDSSTSEQKIVKKFQLWARTLYPRYFQYKDAAFHQEIILNLVRWYRGETNYICAAFRGAAKTTYFKLFIVYVLLNDQDLLVKHLKVLTKDLKNSKQVVTDAYNLIVEARDIYGEMFDKDSDKKREETMSSFTLADGRKLASGTVGQTQRGHIQDAYRPDRIWFDDVEDRESIRSATVTRSVISRAEEAIDGLAKDGRWALSCNYISDQGTVEHFMQKQNVVRHIIPIEEEGEPLWSIYSKEEIEQLRQDSFDFPGEYLCDPTRSSDKFFDLDKIDEQIEKAKEAERKSAGVHYWGSYKPHRRYGIGCDTSEGVGRDSNTLVLFDFDTGEQLVSYENNKIAPDLFGYEAIRVGEEFGNCLLAIERNNTGHATIAAAKGYPNLYLEKQSGTVQEKTTQKYGWHTNARSKPMMFFRFKKDFNDGLIKINDERILMEMKHYTHDDLQDQTAGLITRHFDLLTAAVIAWQMKDHAQAGSDLDLDAYYEDLARTANHYGAAS